MAEINWQEEAIWLGVAFVISFIFDFVMDFEELYQWFLAPIGAVTVRLIELWRAKS